MEGLRPIAVAGTHGKTTTTSMLAVALRTPGPRPSYAIGGDLDAPGSNGHHGDGRDLRGRGGRERPQLPQVRPRGGRSSSTSNSTTTPTTPRSTRSTTPSRPSPASIRPGGTLVIGRAPRRRGARRPGRRPHRPARRAGRRGRRRRPADPLDHPAGHDQRGRRRCSTATEHVFTVSVPGRHYAHNACRRAGRRHRPGSGSRPRARRGARLLHRGQAAPSAQGRARRASRSSTPTRTTPPR